MSHSPESDSEVFVGLITANYDHLRRYIYTLLPHEEDTKDVLQEVCLELSRKFQEYDRSRPFLPWACRFAYLKVLKFYEQQRPRRMIRLPVEVLELLARDRESEEPALAERLAALGRCLEKLTDRDRRLIQARYVDRIPTDEIAGLFAQSRRTMFRNLGIDRGDCLGERLRRSGLLQRQSPIATQHRLDRFSEPRPKFHLAGDRPPRDGTNRPGFENKIVAEFDGLRHRRIVAFCYQVCKLSLNGWLAV